MYAEAVPPIDCLPPYRKLNESATCLEGLNCTTMVWRMAASNMDKFNFVCDDVDGRLNSYHISG